MPQDFSHRVMHGGASLPDIGSGAVLGTGVGGVVQRIDLLLSRYQRFAQTTPSTAWEFLHNVGRQPVVQILNPEFKIITDSVNYEADETKVRVWTEGVSITGFVDLFWFGPVGQSTEGGESTTPGTITEIDGGTY